MFKETYEISKIQTELAVKILVMNVDLYREDLTDIYIAKLKEMGVIIRYTINYFMIYEIIRKVYGEIGVIILKPYLDTKDTTNHLFLSTKNFIEPSVHLLFILGIWADSDSFIYMY